MLLFTTTTTNLLVGNSFKIKDHLKDNLKARWDPDTRSWAIPIHLDCEHLRQELNAMDKQARKAEREANKEQRERTAEREREQRIFMATPEGREFARKERIALNTARREDDKQRMARGEDPVYWWINCLECEVINWKTKMTSCDACADDHGFFKNTIRIKGMRYTGD